MDNFFCGGCSTGGWSASCQNSFKKKGVIKVHWECWSECNLACAFCYRTRGFTLDTDQAKQLIRAVKTSGASQLVFAGGDPSIRPDIVSLIDYTLSLGLKVEVQTNAHRVKPEFLQVLSKVDLVGLSLDGPDAKTHDTFRNKQGNFVRVLSTLEKLDSKGIPVMIRSVVARANHSSIPKMGHLLERFSTITRWSLLEFSAVGMGYQNRENYYLDSETFESVVAEAQNSYKGDAEINIYRADQKVGTYVLITPSGLVYGTTEKPVNGVFPTVGSIIKDHLSTIASKLPFSQKNHLKRYQSLIS